MTHKLSADQALAEIAALFGMTAPHASDVVLAVRMLLDVEQSHGRALATVVDILDEREPQKPLANDEAVDAALRAADRAQRDKWTLAERDLALSRAIDARDSQTRARESADAQVKQLRRTVERLTAHVSACREAAETRSATLRAALRAIGTALGVHPMGHRNYVLLAREAEHMRAERDRLRTGEGS